jgi:hypothetical protein
MIRRPSWRESLFAIATGSDPLDTSPAIKSLGSGSQAGSSHAAICRRRRSNLSLTRLAHSRRKARSELVRMPLAAVTYLMMRLYSAAASCWFCRAVRGFRNMGVTLLMSCRQDRFGTANNGSLMLNNVSAVKAVILLVCR